MSGEESILRALQAGVTAAVAASTVPTLPVSYVGVGFTVPDDQKWLEIVWLPNNVQGDLWGNEKTYRGILRIILHWPNNGAGPYGPLGLIGSISDYFYKGRMLADVQIYEKPDLINLLQDGDDTLYPVSLRYISYRKGTS